MPSINFTYENRGFLTLMVGPSGAGKTTFCEKYFSDADARLPNGDANPLYLPNAAGTAVFIPYYISRHESLFQSELPRILAGDGFGGVHVIDLRNQFND